MATVKTFPFELVGSDGGPLRGEIRTAAPGTGRPVVVICHGFKGFKNWGFFPHLAHRLAHAGLAPLTFNFSGSGVGSDGETFSETDRFAHATHSGDLEDIGIICTAVREGRLAQDVAVPKRLGLFGHSRGGGTAALFASQQPGVDALVTWAAIATVHRWSDEVVAEWRRNGKIDIVNARTGDVLPLCADLLDDINQHAAERLDILGAAPRIEASWLIVHGDADESVPVSDGFNLRDARPTGQTELLIVENATHTFGARHPWSGSTPQLDEAMGRTVEWFTRWLL